MSPESFRPPASVCRLRPARPEDRDRFWEWRNDPDVRRYSFHPEPISLSIHERWFTQSLRSPHRQLYVIEVDSAPAGSLRFDAKGEGEAEISIVIASGFRGMGVGAAVLKQAQKLAATLGYKRLFARVKVENIPSRRAFEKAGFQLIDQDHVACLYEAELTGVCPAG
ncbi:GNAT family N-acetyltransferase [Caldinitratiruptor microaerophilus]|uniref:GNAT family N-acetyltransferase n=1 Tax=Caldinitratiruptor microaerophilus TaxID=671077 RepID=UPI00222E1E91|nr:GNAT family N-acetyltransferase [Caldinitratiruptor microaerophilus]